MIVYMVVNVYFFVLNLVQVILYGLYFLCNRFYWNVEGINNGISIKVEVIVFYYVFGFLRMFGFIVF